MQVNHGTPKLTRTGDSQGQSLELFWVDTLNNDQEQPMLVLARTAEEASSIALAELRKQRPSCTTLEILGTSYAMTHWEES